MIIGLVILLGVAIVGIVAFVHRRRTPTTPPSRCPSVNYHFTRQCNYSCKFCFHTAKSRDVLTFEEIKVGLDKLKAAGMRKINFSGGEPFLQKKLLGEMVDYCKQTLHLNVSIVSNGSLITRDWIEDHKESVDIIAISCDSFVEDTNRQIGRRAGASGASSRGGNNMDDDRHSQIVIARRVAEWCRAAGIDFKMNTVVTSLNVDEDMSGLLEELAPRRWKVFQCLLLDGENAGGEQSLRDARELVVPNDKFQSFIERHRHLNPVVESNEDMKDSYLILDEKMRFLDCTSGGKIPSQSILEVSVDTALDHSGFDSVAFERRGGTYNYDRVEHLQNSQQTLPTLQSLIRTASSSASTSSCSAFPGGLVDIEDMY